MSVTNPLIEHPELMEGEKSKECDLMDPRQGPPDRNSKCKICAGSCMECEVFFDTENQLILLYFATKSVYRVAFLLKIVKFWHCDCFHCSNSLIDPNDSQIVDIMKKQISGLDLNVE